MNKKHRLSVITISASFLFAIGVSLAIVSNSMNLRKVGADTKSYTLNLASKSFLNNKRVTASKGNTVNFSITNIMYYDDWQALAIPSSTEIYEGSFSNTSPIHALYVSPQATNTATARPLQKGESTP